MNSTDVADIIEAGIALLEERGRTRKHLEAPDGRVCVVGAIHVIQRWRGRLEPACSAIAGYLADNGLRVRPKGCMSAAFVGDWNDETEDDEEVIDVLRHVVKELRNGER